MVATGRLGERFAIIALIVVGLINLYPVTGVLSAAQLASLYGIEINDPDLLLLMRHRAVLFGLLGTLLLVAAFRPTLRLLAGIAALISMVSFVVLAFTAGDYGAALHRVVIADIFASPLVVVVLLLETRRTGGK